MNMIKRLKQGINDPLFYKTFLKESLWKAFLLLFLLNLVLSVPKSMVTGYQSSQIIKELETTFQNNFSGIVFNDYQLSTVDGDTLFYDFSINGVDIAIVFDTVDVYSIADLTTYDMGYIFDSEYIVRYTPGLTPVKTYYTQFKPFIGDISLSGSQLAQVMKEMQITSAISLVLVGFFSAIIFVIFTALLISIAASMNSSMMKLKLSYSNNLKIALYSMIIPIIGYQLLTLIPYVPDLLLLFGFYLLSGRYISRTYRNIYTDSIEQAILKYSKTKKAEEERKAEEEKESQDDQNHD